MEKENSALFSRRSVRVFNDKPISKEQINYLLEAAMHAPSASNGRSWEFVVSQQREHFIKIVDACPYYKPLNTATIVILVCFNNGTSKYAGNQIIMASDCGAASQNILLAAKEQGMGSVWMAVSPDPVRVEAAKKLFNLPNNVEPFSLIALGYHDTVINKPHVGFDEDKVHFETF